MALFKYISRLPETAAETAFPRNLVILGSTGSIGVSALNAVQEHPEDFNIIGLAGARNIEKLAEQALTFRPPLLGVLTEQGADDLVRRLPADYTPEIVIGPDGYKHMAALPQAEFVLAAQVGAAGLEPTLAAVEAGKIIALANKEALVMAGELIRERCLECNAVILPVDSEHNALFQSMAGHDIQEISRLIITASGGPFRGKPLKFLETAGPETALKHPNWSMGAKISIDSATLMNKGLEVIEACRLFGCPPSAIKVVVHPQSIIHSLVEYIDGSVLAHLGPPDMRIPIAYCLAYPKRLSLTLQPLDLIQTGTLTFEEPNTQTFPCLQAALDSLDPNHGPPGRTIVLNAANEIAVDGFLSKRIGFMDIPRLILDELKRYADNGHKEWLSRLDTPEGIISLDKEIRSNVAARIDPDTAHRTAQT